MRTHQAHNAADVIRRWRQVARAAAMKCREVCTAEGFPVIALESRRQSASPLYLSAGIHGDEAAPVQGLLAWAEANVARLAKGSVIIFPLLNPAGLTLNTRTDAGGIDLNRSFHLDDHPMIAGWRRIMSGRRMTLACCLHEDYDSQGTYCYELSGDPSGSAGHRMLEVTADLIARDLRPIIEGRKADRGLIRRRRVPRLPGLPEAIALFGSHASITLTLESPSEFSLDVRTRAHARWVEEAWRMTQE